MNRRTLVAAFAAACVSVLALVGVVALTGSAEAATSQKAFFTFYGWWDNTPPGGDIAYPKIHDTAGGVGSFADPITFAAATAAAPAGTKIWVPRVKKYFIMEDGCDECNQDWNGNGPNGGPKLYHFDLWLGGEDGSPFDAINCEDALTHYNTDGSATLEDVVINPPSTEPYDRTPIFNTSSGACYGGAQPNTIVGSFKNTSTGRCLSSPVANPGSGVKLQTDVCDGNPKQIFTFEGAFMMIGRQCATISGSNIQFATCDGGPKQQWSLNLNNFTISDIQTSKKCFRASGNALTAGSCSGTASQWTFPSSTPTTPPTTPPAPSGTVQAETGTLSAGGTFDSNHAGFTGTGFANPANAVGGYVDIPVPATAAGTRTVTFRFSNGSTAARPATISVNGTSRGTLDFPATANWDTWSTVSIAVPLTAGTNTIRVAATTANGDANIDSLTVS
jgi:hypothetical protein